MSAAFASPAQTGAKPLVRFEGVTRRFGGVVAVDNLSLDIHAAEFFALLGPSGCGKTTLLRLLAGFERPDEGRILLDDEDITDLPPYRRPVNMMFQSYALFPHLTVAGNIAFGLKQEGMARGDIAVRVDELLALVRLDGLGKRYPHQLSGGQRQRVALARSLAKRPKVLLLDEPMAALDKKLRAETQLELTKLQKQLGTTFVIVTHDQEEAMTVADRIAVMNRGRLAQVAPPAEIYETPASRWVAEFIGDINLIEGAIETVDDGMARIVAAGDATVRMAARDGATKGAKVWVAIRPEKLSLSNTSANASGENSFDGVIEDIVYRGNTLVYRVRADAGLMLKVSMANTQRVTDFPNQRGGRVSVSFSPDAGVLLTD